MKEKINDALCSLIGEQVRVTAQFGEGEFASQVSVAGVLEGHPISWGFFRVLLSEGTYTYVRVPDVVVLADGRTVDYVTRCGSVGTVFLGPRHPYEGLAAAYTARGAQLLYMGEDAA